MTNTQIAEQFELLSKLMDLHGENSFKTKTYAVLAYNIEKLGVELSTLGEEDLFSMKGIGESTGRKILELLQTGHMAVLDHVVQIHSSRYHAIAH
jgi:DNA polymerase (family 10)